ncbi:16S rRNA (cytosine(967)-C(5))-methyltransferase RsmB [Candidatus Thiothrix sp. Deng01]|uniref:16S rRNA (cytosine(967)-C(5))-methyltransferase n=1 Tax=Candidatus Thiothrix phosphatis TaxID=3112415 RepID=A0ABU6D0E4_9GAMM|nr:16S rRNA (cytosine(967)-C(5))-methyltransferase RsmB [Candidatus Thiothrix sp. Deng01]MEB4592531.1 16S rRNA (cytosine(967)-C(5))-methyltransferase RsmB [Candidatus Thiothrix sp. Deng01]
MSVRSVAARCLLLVIYEGESLTDVLQGQAVASLNAQDQALLRDLCFGALRWHERLNAILALLLAKPLKKADKDVECLLRVGLYQLLYQRTPDHAAVNETVKAASKLKKSWAGGLVNGVLRAFLRQQADLLAQADAEPTARYAFPAWLLTRIRQAWPQDWEAILTASNAHPPMTLRVNQRQQSTQAYQHALQAAGIPAGTVPEVASALDLSNPVSVEQLPGFSAGAVSVQDAAAQLAAGLLDCQPGMRVLDACAAPGGKTGHLLEMTGDLELTAIDNSAARLRRVTENLSRLQVQGRVMAADAGDPPAWWDGNGFDRILLDAPCSATGVIRRHPDIKVLRRDSDIAALQQEQQRLLHNLWTTLRPGGKLLYATCSILPEENLRQMEAFMDAQHDAVPLPIQGGWGRALAIGRQILPGEQGMDGFYYALLHKVAQD